MPPAVAVPARGDLAMCKLIIIHHKTDISMSGVGELFLYCRWLGYLQWLCQQFVQCWGYVRMSLAVVVPALGGLVMCMLTMIHHNMDVGMSDVGGLFLYQRWLYYHQWLCQQQG